mmetsp:Transcript_5347/g.17558  ORF Transcript_5347/g.17558 Transcript_5347/m.17558 type:complete len:101 (+) Transcript_5347:434-736(+)
MLGNNRYRRRVGAFVAPPGAVPSCDFVSGCAVVVVERSLWLLADRVRGPLWLDDRDRPPFFSRGAGCCCCWWPARVTETFDEALEELDDGGGGPLLPLSS